MLHHVTGNTSIAITSKMYMYTCSLLNLVRCCYNKTIMVFFTLKTVLKSHTFNQNIMKYLPMYFYKVGS